jgi:THO complex subunit 5
MLNRLSFELAERQRSAISLITCFFLILSPPVNSLDLKKKNLTQQKEELLKETKAKAATLDSVKIQIDTLMKVRT